MLATIDIGQNIDFASLKTEPFSNVTHFRLHKGRVRSMRITNLGTCGTVLRRRLDSNFYFDGTVTARYAVGELVRHDDTSPDGWGSIPSVVQESQNLFAVSVFVLAPRLEDSYGKSWAGRGGMNSEEFLRDILASLR